MSRELVVLLFALIGALVIGRVEIARESPLPPLKDAPAGCRFDVLTGVLDCAHYFPDGTFIHTRGL
jgi:hypothetical protein